MSADQANLLLGRRAYLSAYDPGSSPTIMSVREDIKITSHGEQLAAWVYPATGASPEKKSPAIVMGHGLGCVKEMRLDAYCERFSKAGYVCVAFDYRYFGGST